EIRSDSPAPRLSKVMKRENAVRRLNSRAAIGHSHMCSICQIQVGTHSRSTGPSPTTWYAMYRSPERAYLVSGTMLSLTVYRCRGMDFELSDEQQLVRETARDFTDNEIVERARENDRNEHFDVELVGKIAQQGYLGAIVPRDYGGAGLDYLTYGLIVEEVGRGW